MKAWFLLVLWLVAGTVTAEPRVVASIPPLHSLVAAVTEGVAEPHLLVRGGASPHAYAMRPSDLRALTHADLVVWVGPVLERFLVQPLSELPGTATLAVEDLPGVTRLPLRVGGSWEADTDHDDHAALRGAGHEADIDPHVWLDPRNGRVIATALAERLARIDPAHAAQYRANRDRVVARLTALEAQLQDQLAPVKRVPYAVFHDAFHYFENRFDLNAIGSVTVSPDQRPGARRLVEIRQKIRQLGARCVFTEPQFRPALVQVVVEHTGARVGTLDPLGAELAPGPRLYPQLLENLATDLRGCLLAR